VNAIDQVCASIVGSVDDAWAAAVVVIDSGAVVGSYSATDELSRPAVAAVARDVVALAVRALGLDHSSRTVDELYLATARHSQFAKVVRGGRGLLVVATTRLTNVGMGWTQVRGCTPMVESLPFWSQRQEGRS
jgi:predicted regulator of Ras-like GTPase activity (Roadblock/LC7/MglB family)